MCQVISLSEYQSRDIKSLNLRMTKQLLGLYDLSSGLPSASFSMFEDDPVTGLARLVVWDALTGEVYVQSLRKDSA